MPAQQKAKKERGARNGTRRNGKAWSRGHEKNGAFNLHQMDPSKRKSFFGVSIKTIEKRAAEAGITVTGMILLLKEKRQKRTEYRRSLPPGVRRQLAQEIELKRLRRKLYANGNSLDGK